MFGQGRDGLDWHRLVLGGQREGRDKEGGGASPCDRFIGEGGGALTDEDPDSCVSAVVCVSTS